MEESNEKRILIVDDTPTNIRVLVPILMEHGKFQINISNNGRDALKLLEKVKPDLILLDIMMPKLSGFEVCQQLKADPVTRQIMVLMVTALGELGDIERAVEAGTDDFLSKPVNKIELVKRVENMLKLRHVSDELQRLRSYISSMDNDLPPRQAQS